MIGGGMVDDNDDDDAWIARMTQRARALVALRENAETHWLACRGITAPMTVHRLRVLRNWYGSRQYHELDCDCFVCSEFRVDGEEEDAAVQTCIWCDAPATERVDLFFAQLPACHACHQRHLEHMARVRQAEADRLAKASAAARRGWETRRKRAAQQRKAVGDA